MGEQLTGDKLRSPNRRRILRFKRESYIDTSDIEFLDQLKNFLCAKGIDTEGLVYSGNDAAVFLDENDRPQAIHAMNEAGWREAVRIGEPNPAMFTERESITPAIGIYDGTQIRQVYSYKLHEHGGTTEVEVESVGEPLTELGADRPVTEVVAHVDYPQRSPADALLGVVLLEQEEPPRDTGFAF